MAPPKRNAAEANLFDDPNPNPLAKQKLAAQAHLARAGGRRGANNANTNGNGAHAAQYAQANNVHASLKDLANMSEAVRDRDGREDASVRLESLLPSQLASDECAIFLKHRMLTDVIDLQLEWPKEPRHILIRYRDTHNLPSQTCYRNPSAHLILNTGIGLKSPTMARHPSKRRSTKDELAAAVTRHYKDNAATETECLVELLYRIKTQGLQFLSSILSITLLTQQQTKHSA